MGEVSRLTASMFYIVGRKCARGEIQKVGVGYGGLGEGGEPGYKVCVIYCRCGPGVTAQDPDGWAGLWQAEGRG